jgi:hypothetical protein
MYAGHVVEIACRASDLNHYSPNWCPACVPYPASNRSGILLPQSSLGLLQFSGLPVGDQPVKESHEKPANLSLLRSRVYVARRAQGAESWSKQLEKRQQKMRSVTTRPIMDAKAPLRLISGIKSPFKRDNTSGVISDISDAKGRDKRPTLDEWYKDFLRAEAHNCFSNALAPATHGTIAMPRMALFEALRGVHTEV